MSALQEGSTATAHEAEKTAEPPKPEIKVDSIEPASMNSFKEKKTLASDCEKLVPPVANSHPDHSGSEADHNDLEGQLLNDSDIVDWNGPDDPENPMNWRKWKKTATIVLLCGVRMVTYVSVHFGDPLSSWKLMSRRSKGLWQPP